MGGIIAPAQGLLATQLAQSAVDGVTLVLNGGKATLNLANSNTWTADQTFAGNTTLDSTLTLRNASALALSNLVSPSGASMTASVQTSGTVGSNLAANTTYTYGIDYVNANGQHTALTLMASATEGATAYPIALSWPSVSSTASYTVYRATGNYIGNIPGFYANCGLLASVTTNSYTDDGNTAPNTSVTPVAADNTAPIQDAGSLVLSASSQDVLVLMQDYLHDGHTWRMNIYDAATGAWYYGNFKFSGPSGFFAGPAIQVNTNNGTITLGNTNGSLAWIDSAGNAFFSGALHSLGGQSTSGPLGAGVVVAEAEAATVTTASAYTTFLSFTPPANSLYLVSAYAANDSGASQTIGIQVTWTDPNSGGASTTLFPETSVASPGTAAPTSILIYASSASAIDVQAYTTSTTGVYFSAAILRVA